MQLGWLLLGAHVTCTDQVKVMPVLQASLKDLDREHGAPESFGGSVRTVTLEAWRCLAPMGLLTRSVSRGSGDPTSISAAIYKVTSNVQLLSDAWPEHLMGFALMWTGADRRHRESKSEGIPEDELHHRYFVLHRQMGGPGYHRVLLCAR
eukprot:s1044_g6.t1